jgi:hypothetical protein
LVHPLETLGGGGVYEDNGVAASMEADLEQKGYIPNKGKDLWIGDGGLHGGDAELIDPGMKKRFEAFFLLGVGENDVGDGAPVNIALAVENSVAPPGAQGLFDGRIGIKRADLVVGVKDEATFVGEELRNETLAAADAAGDADDRFS